MMRGWHYEGYRHSLAAKGIRTSFVLNSLKGNRPRPEDMVWDEKKGKFVSWRHVASAYGIPTGVKRQAMKKGDSLPITSGVDVYEGMPKEQPGFSEFSSIPRQVTLPIVPYGATEYERPYTQEQQAQPVETDDGFSNRETQSPLSTLSGISDFGAEGVMALTSLEEAEAAAPQISMAGKTRLKFYVVDYKKNGIKNRESVMDKEDAVYWKKLLKKNKDNKEIKIKGFKNKPRLF